VLKFTVTPWWLRSQFIVVPSRSRALIQVVLSRSCTLFIVEPSRSRAKVYGRAIEVARSVYCRTMEVARSDSSRAVKVARSVFLSRRQGPVLKFIVAPLRSRTQFIVVPSRLHARLFLYIEYPPMVKLPFSCEGSWPLTVAFPAVLVSSLGLELLHAFSRFPLLCAACCCCSCSSMPYHPINHVVLSSTGAIALISFILSSAVNAIIAADIAVMGPCRFPRPRGIHNRR
jgi:hypothetical protein